MAQNKDDYCLECHWETFRIDGKESTDTSDPKEKEQSEVVCPGEEHHTLSRCDVDDDCCEVDDCADNCSITCPSVCDGFVDCDQSTACSVSHCDDNCASDEPVCFEDQCFDETENGVDHGLDSFLGLGGPLNLETSDLLSSTLAHNHLEQASKSADHSASANLDPPSHHPNPTDPSSFFPPYSSTPAAHCPPPVPNHFNDCHFHHPVHPLPSYPVQNGVNPADVFHMLGMCPDLSSCSIPEEQHCQHNYHLNGDTSAFFSCFHTDNHHLGHTDHDNNFNTNTNNSNNNNCHHHHRHQSKSVNAGDHAPAKGPCRSHHRCRVHAHHTHPYSFYSRQSRSSISSHLMSSPGETPPPLDGGASSVITSPEFSPVDREMHACKWSATTLHGVKHSCGATFSDAGALQKHLISCHMSTVDGAKGNGYYCCWDGCHRPHEPFSQKSKLQGHFLTHSNYKNFKCTVCGKVFARQATLDRHERSHRGEKPYKCADCGKTFTDSSELKTHSRTHTGEKPFRCTYPGCDFQTGDSSNMSSHRLTHGERRHKCHFPGCSKSFTRPDQLKRHIKSTHKEEMPPFPTSPGTDEFALSYGIIA